MAMACTREAAVGTRGGWGCAAAPPEGNERETAPGPGKAAGWVGEANGRPPTKRNGEFCGVSTGLFAAFLFWVGFAFLVRSLHILNRRLSSSLCASLRLPSHISARSIIVFLGAGTAVRVVSCLEQNRAALVTFCCLFSTRVFVCVFFSH
jgi:hypothetical protein